MLLSYAEPNLSKFASGSSFIAEDNQGTVVPCQVFFFQISQFNWLFLAGKIIKNWYIEEVNEVNPKQSLPL